MRKSWEIHEKVMKSHEKVIKKSLESHEKVIRKAWESLEKVIKKKSWESHKKAEGQTMNLTLNMWGG